MIALRIAVLAVVVVCCLAASLAAWRVKRLRWLRAHQALTLAWLVVVYAWAVADPLDPFIKSGVPSQIGLLSLALSLLANVVLDWDGHA